MAISDRLGSDHAAVSSRIANVSRRQFLQGASGLALGLYLGPAFADENTGAAAAAVFEPNAFVRIGGDNIVTVVSKHLEMGQGTFTGLATLVAEELDADWAQVVVEAAPADAKRYANLLFGIQGTGGSTAMANSWEQMRKAGAAARAMLVAAAASEWKVPAAQIHVEHGIVSHAASKHQATFGQLAAKAAQQAVPTDVKLKDPKQFKLIGSVKTPRKDSAAKTNGSAMFTQDLRLPNMLVAVVAHPPRFGGTVKSVDMAKAKAVAGVVDIVQFAGKPGVFPAGVAVLAKNTWTAKQGRDALVIEWDDSQAFKLSSEEIFTQFRELAKKPGLAAHSSGDAAKALTASNKRIEAEYEFPYLAHGAMEPMNCAVQLSTGKCEIWHGEQLHTADQGAVAGFLGIPLENVALNQLYAGGSFGRRANPKADFVLEAVAIAKAAGDKGIKAPIKMVWTREEDTRGGYYRPANLHTVRAALDASGKPIAWQQRIVGQSLIKGSPFESALIKNGIDATSVEGADNLPYAIPNLQVELHSSELAVPVQWWRSVGHTHTAFSTESMIDELATAAGKDPYQFRRELLDKHPRHRGVLEMAAVKSGWGTPLAAKAGVKRGRGIAVHESFNSFVAEVVEVSVQKDGTFKVDRVVCAVDCGVAINPDVIKAQMEGGIGYGLAATLYSEITLKDGVVQESNFDRYRPLRINEMPLIEVHIVPSAEKPTGVGEPGTPPIAPALANALFAATGKRIRKLPIGTQLQA
jgi:isoquinoline 1-oxidoreductase subunit beta